MRRWRKASALTLLAAIALALAGCSQSPLAPESLVNGGSGGTSTAPPILTFSADGSVDYVAPSTVTLDGSVSAAGTLTTNAVSASATIQGSKGGLVQAGRFSVILPPGAFKGTATITVTMPDSTVMICDLAISPQSANKFKYPAVLTANLSGLTVDATGFTMYWYDPSRNVWVNLFSQSITTSSSVSAFLSHFSTYAAGKAGW